MHIEAPGDDKPVVVVNQMSFNYHDCDYGVKDIHFTLYPGDRVLLIGHNGCGKSTLLSLLGGRRKATTGTITVLGVDAFEETGLNHRVALLGPPWPPEAYFANSVDSVASPSPNVARKEAIASHLHLPLSAPVDKMSSGEKRRVQILHGMLHEAEVFLLDECSTDIDVAERKTVLDLVRRECEDRESTIGSDITLTPGVKDDCKGHRRKQRACCIYATHILDGVEGWATHVALMDDQRIIDFRPIEDVAGLNYALPQSALSITPHSATTVDGRGQTHVAAASAVAKRNGDDDDDNASTGHVMSPFTEGSHQQMSLEQYAHAFISKNRSREKRYRCYLSAPVVGPEASTIIHRIGETNSATSATVNILSSDKLVNHLDHAAINAQANPLLKAPINYSEDYIIRCRGVTIDGILSECSIDIRRGSRTLLLGCNGSGKSTLLNIWGGKRVYLQRKPSCGVTEAPSQPEGQVIFPPISTNNDGSLPVRGMHINGIEMYSNMKTMVSATTYGGDWWTKVPGGEMRVWDLVDQPMTRRAFEIANLLQLDWSWDVRYLSAGEQKRVQLLLVMQFERPLVILDEATADLDVDQRHELLKFLFLESVYKGTTVIYTTHIFEGLSGWPSEIMFLDRTVQGVVKVRTLDTFEQAEDPCLFKEVTDTLVSLKAAEHFKLR